jgi:hypothetical protein
VKSSVFPSSKSKIINRNSSIKPNPKSEAPSLTSFPYHPDKVVAVQLLHFIPSTRSGFTALSPESSGQQSMASGGVHWLSFAIHSQTDG